MKDLLYTIKTTGWVLVMVAGGLVSCTDSSSRVDFNTQVRPILNKNCMSCHGGVRQNGGLSFLFPEMALDTLDSGKFAIVPGSPKKSALIHRVLEEDPELRMPPEGPGLSQEEINVLSEWIRQGAEWDDHWAYKPPDPAIEPPVIDESGSISPIDQFVSHKLSQQGLKMSEEADKATLLRRVSFDLVGLPPDQQTAANFLSDNSSNAYEELVDRLLSSEHFGERWASFWLDLARYADSQGYQKDNLRPTMWMYRDWVIEAFNEDMPFDQFTIDQLAGDLMTNPTDDQMLATVFHRNTMSNDEGGTDDEEFRVAAVLDRVNTTFEVWQGTTMSCVQCHTHPYDPIKHEEYYGVYAFFNNTRDSDKTNDYPTAMLLSGPQKNLKEHYKEQLSSYKEKGDTVSTKYLTSLERYLSIKPLKVPVMQEFPADSSRKSHVFVRGNWLVHGDEIQPSVPQAMNQSVEERPSDRLELAQWLVNPKNPLTARVTVNRFWEQLFGRGLVETVEDFGSQGSMPVYPGLLDWLAVQFMQEYQWSVKSLLRKIVLSQVYRQSSRVSPELLERDPYNRLLARGPRIRLSAEQIRDQALAVSGLLNERLYGPSVMPPQPEGVWNVIRHRARWETPKDPELQHRRALYTFWRRVSPYPSMMTFDATSREFCVSRRIRTNTPLQAFVTLNDPVFFNATKALAVMMHEASSKVEKQIEFGFKQTLYRNPTDSEVQSLKALFNKTVELYRQQPDQVKEITADTDINSIEMAATINLAAAIMNLDEIVTKS